MSDRRLNSFKIISGNKILDYRLGQDLDLNKIQCFFKQKYLVKKIWKSPRHILGILAKDDKNYFLKLSTSEGISIVTKNEYNWNNYFHKYFPKDLPYSVPRNYDSGIYQGKYFYLITDYFAGKLLCEVRDANIDSNHLIEYIPQIIDLAEEIQKLPEAKFTDGDENNYLVKFVNKAKSWFTDIPISVSRRYQINNLLTIVEEADHLFSRPRHGDFAPWHMIKLEDGKLGLIDGEHALTNSVENYDICYFIQRVFSVLKNPVVAKEIYLKLLNKGYKVNKLKIILAARAIGGFLDESLKEKPDYKIAKAFNDWVITG